MLLQCGWVWQSVSGPDLCHFPGTPGKELIQEDFIIPTNRLKFYLQAQRKRFLKWVLGLFLPLSQSIAFLDSWLHFSLQGISIGVPQAETGSQGGRWFHAMYRDSHPTGQQQLCDWHRWQQLRSTNPILPTQWLLPFSSLPASCRGHQPTRLEGG